MILTVPVPVPPSFDRLWKPLRFLRFHFLLVWTLFAQGISGNEARKTSMTRLFESTCASDIPDIRVRANQYRSTFEPEECILTPLSAAAIFSRNRVVEALLSEPTVKVY